MAVRGRGRSSSQEWANTVNNGGEPAAVEPSLNPSESVTLSLEEYEQLLHRSVANFATPATSSSPGAFVASHGESWMLDSGATTHLNGNCSHFSTLSTSHKFPPVLLANGSYPPISGSGTIQSTNHLTLTNDLQTQRTIGGGHECGGLYFLNTSPPVAVCALSASVSPLQWHCRLGHPFFLTLKKVLPIKSPRLECESCELGKHHRASFPLELTNNTWVYLLKDRYEVPTIITSFYNEINTQFSVNIHIFRTDNALEFVRKAVFDFCDSKRILHQTSCPYTSQQNGVAERKHHHLLDVARTIMTHMHVPKSYRGDVILTACYLINRIPSSVLSRDTPYSCIFPDRPLFGVTPRVFVRVCFVHVHSPTLDKLSPHSVKCIFQGYSRVPKGYRCYDPQYRWFFTSADVTLFESTPYYSPNSSPVIPHTSIPLPIPTLTIPPHKEPPTRPLQVYSCRNHSTNTTLTVPPGLLPTAAPGNPSATPANDFPIALQKGKRSCTTLPLAHSLSFQYLSPNYRAFSVSFSSISIPNTYCEALWHPAWKMNMDDEMSALISRGTWELVEVPPNANVVAFRWVFTLKFQTDGTLERYKTRLIAKGFTQTYGVDYFEIFSLVTRLNSIRALFSSAVNLN
ncbi:UNVERIFIED_CONTAM: Retrovirus-related Pol polyprotein from transposon RE2 [Sesamum angustifolium]|uniref:Retrovirus-related Pol polyprotein from transposon RE2 n=1 Tax=Sesamum angustifolium TaxID=2727405 RepID=A0AAW2IMR9_9LAMI